MSPSRNGIGMTSERTRLRLLDRLRTNGISDPRLLDVMRQVPRHLFVDEALANRAYDDMALPIGHGQTMSQPFVVALMTQALFAAGPLNRVLEIGTGCGYQTAILSRLVERVYTIERIGELFRQSRDRLFVLGYRNIQFGHGDGMNGWPEHAPYDGILTTAAPAVVPESLLDQLAVGGRLILPVGSGDKQRLLLITRNPDGFLEQEIDQVKFVPLLSGTIR